jgi:hypothetical protein
MLAFRQPKIMEVDSVLLQHVEELCSGEIVHFLANLSGVYRSSLEEFECIGGYLPVDCGGSSSGVVILLAKRRQKRGLPLRWE